MTTAQDALAERRRNSYELWQQMARPWERRRDLNWRSTRVVSEWLVGRIDPQPGATVLELAAGTGETGFLAARRLGERGRLVSSDFSPEMVRAAERVAHEAGVATAEFRVLDAEDLDLEDATTDGVLCRYGYMLMARPLQALSETRRVLRPAARVAFSTWGEPELNPWMTLAAAPLVDRGYMQPLARSGPGVFSMSTAATIVPLLVEAGFGDIEVEPIDMAWRLADTAELWAFASELQGPVALAIARLAEDERLAVRATIEERAAAYWTGRGYELPGLSVNVAATA